MRHIRALQGTFAFAIVMIAMLTGCTNKVMVEGPPVAPVENIKSIAVVALPYSTSSPYRAAIIDKVVETLRRYGYQVPDYETVMSILQAQSGSERLLSEPDPAALANLLEADAVLVVRQRMYARGERLSFSGPGWDLKTIRTPYLDVRLEATLIDLQAGGVTWSVAYDTTDARLTDEDVIDQFVYELRDLGPSRRYERRPPSPSEAAD